MAVAKAASKTVEERLQEFEDKEGVLRNLNQYVRTLDYGAPTSQWLDLFIETGVWRSSVDAPLSGTGGLRLEGHKELADWFELSKRHTTEWQQTPRLRHKHIYTDIDIRIDGDRATSSAYYFTVGNHEEGIQIGTMGRYEDRLVRCPDGRWRFEERHLCREGAGLSGRNVTVGGHEKPGEKVTVGTVV